MAITGAYRAVQLDQPDMDMPTFVALLVTNAGFTTDLAARCYERIERHKGSHALALAIFHHESGWGKLGVCAVYGTKSPGNTRSRRIAGIQTLVTVPGKGQYVKYASWEDGFEDLAYRLVDPAFRYVQEGADTIEEIIPIWAPASDGNSPTGYISAVLRDMNLWNVALPQVLDRNAMLARLERDFPLAIIVDHIPEGNPNRPGGPLVSEGRLYITWHETANEKVGADALMHRTFAHNGGGAGNVSFTWVVDSKRAVNLLPRWEKSWQASDGAAGIGNSSESIELCVNADGDWAAAKENLARLTARLIIEDQDNDWERIRQHHDWARDKKNCPARLRANGNREYHQVRARVKEILTAVGYYAPARPTQAPDSREFDVPGHGRFIVWGGFYHYWESQGGLGSFGFPLNNSYQLDDGTWAQDFERARFEWRPDIGDPALWHVVLGRVNAELIEVRLALAGAESHIDQLEARLAELEAQAVSA